MAAVLPRPWLRVLLGAAAAQLAVLACLPNGSDWFGPDMQARFGIAWDVRDKRSWR